MKILSVSRLFLSTLFCFVALLIISCEKADQSQTNTTDTDFGILYYVKNLTLTAFDLNKNNILWKTDNVFAWDFNGICYDNGIIYTGNLYGIAATDAKTGSIKWKTQLAALMYSQSGFFPDNHPVLKDSLIYFISYSDYSGTFHPTLHCINKNDGSIKWRKDLTPGTIGAEKIYTTPVIINDKIVALSNTTDNAVGWHKIFCFNRITGQQIWENRSITDYLISYPFAADTTQIIFASNNSRIYSLNINNGSMIWNSSVFPKKLNPVFKPIIHNNELFFFSTSPGSILVVDKNSGMLNRVYTDTLNCIVSMNDKIFVQRYTNVICSKDINTYNQSWSWEAPSKKIFDTVSLGQILRFSNSFSDPVVTDGRIVYYYENVFDKNREWKNPDINSIYMLNAQTGKLEKEIKIGSTNADDLLGRNFIIVKNEKSYKSPITSY